MEADTTHAIGNVEVAILFDIAATPLAIHKLRRREFATSNSALHLHSVNVAREDQVAIAERPNFTPQLWHMRHRDIELIARQAPIYRS